MEGDRAWIRKAVGLGFLVDSGLCKFDLRRFLPLSALTPNHDCYDGICCTFVVFDLVWSNRRTTYNISNSAQARSHECQPENAPGIREKLRSCPPRPSPGVPSPPVPGVCFGLEILLTRSRWITSQTFVPFHRSGGASRIQSASGQRESATNRRGRTVVCRKAMPRKCKQSHEPPDLRAVLLFGP